MAQTDATSCTVLTSPVTLVSGPPFPYITQDVRNKTIGFTVKLEKMETKRHYKLLFRAD